MIGWWVRLAGGGRGGLGKGFVESCGWSEIVEREYRERKLE